MFNNFVEEKSNKDTTLSNPLSTNNNSKTFAINQSALVKLTENETENNVNCNESEINEIEKKLSLSNKPELFTRENQVSKDVEEVIDVPKKIIKDEASIISEDFKQNEIKKQMRERENEKDKEKRQKELDIDAKKIEEYKKNVKIYNLKIRKKTIILFFKYLLLILLISGFLIFLIIYLD